MGRHNISMPTEWWHAAQRAASRRGLSVSSLIRVALATMLPDEMPEAEDPDAK